MNHRLETVFDRTQAVAVQVMVGTLAAAYWEWVAGLVGTQQAYAANA